MSTGRGWKNPLSVVVVSGKHEYLRNRELRRAIQAANSLGRRVVWVGAGDEAGLQEVLSGGFLFSESTLAIVDSAASRKRKAKGKAEEPAGAGTWSDEAVEMVIEHGKASFVETALVLHHVGEVGATSMAGRFLVAFPKGRQAHFPELKPWEEKDFAVKFLMGEVKSRGKSIDEALAEAVVRQTGTELGALSFEALKMSQMLDVDGRTEVRKEDLIGLIASFGAEDWQLLKDALASRNAKAVIRVLGDIRKGPVGDSVMRVCIIISRTVMQWLHAAALIENGVGEEEAATRVGMHPYPFKKSVLPAAQRWGKAALTALLNDVATVEGGVKKGFASPWIALEGVLVQACGSGR